MTLPLAAFSLSPSVARSRISRLCSSHRDASALLARTLQHRRRRTAPHRTAPRRAAPRRAMPRLFVAHSRTHRSSARVYCTRFSPQAFSGLPPRASRPSSFPPPPVASRLLTTRKRWTESLVGEERTSLATWRTLLVFVGLVSVLAQPSLHARYTRAKFFPCNLPAAPFSRPERIFPRLAR